MHAYNVEGLVGGVLVLHLGDPCELLISAMSEPYVRLCELLLSAMLEPYVHKRDLSQIVSIHVESMLTTGKSVAVLEARVIGAGQTGRTTAHLMPWNDDYYALQVHSASAHTCDARPITLSHECTIKTVSNDRTGCLPSRCCCSHSVD